jgi:uncharacterized protein
VSVPPDSVSPPPPPHPELGPESRGWAVAAHLSGPVLLLASAGLLAFLGPLVIWFVKRDDDAFVGHHALEALNFQITAAAVVVLAWLLAIPTVILGILTLGVGFLVAAALALVAVGLYLVTVVQGSLRASNGEGYRYPVSVRFVRG